MDSKNHNFFFKSNKSNKLGFSISKAQLVFIKLKQAFI